MREIRRLIIEGHSHSDIQRQLNLPEKTYYRYYDSCFKEDRAHMLQSVTPTESLNQLTIVQERLNAMFKNIHSIAADQNVDPEVRVGAENLAAGVFNSWEESPLGGIRILKHVEQPALSLLTDEEIKSEIMRREEAESVYKQRVQEQQQKREKELREGKQQQKRF